MRRLLRVYRTSPVGGGVVLVLAAAVLVLAFGSGESETPAWVVIAVVIALICLRATPWFRRRA